MTIRFAETITKTGAWLIALTALGLAASCGEPQEEASAESTGRVADASNPLDDFCADTQRHLAGTSLETTNIIHDKWPDYTASKPEVDETELVSHQFLYQEGLPNSGEPYVKIISCKTKSSDRIKTFRGEDAAGTQSSCGAVNRRTVERVIDRLKLDDPPEIIYDEDDSVLMGPQWLEPWPYKVAYEDESGALHFRGKGMLIPYSKLIPMPDRFKGVHYCHLVAPDYAEALLTGKIEAPEL